MGVLVERGWLAAPASHLVPEPCCGTQVVDLFPEPLALRVQRVLGILQAGLIQLVMLGSQACVAARPLAILFLEALDLLLELRHLVGQGVHINAVEQARLDGGMGLPRARHQATAFRGGSGPCKSHTAVRLSSPVSQAGQVGR